MRGRLDRLLHQQRWPVTFLRYADYPAWSQCAGRPALEESEGGVPDESLTLTVSQRSELEARKGALEGATTVEVLPLQSLPVGLITAEKGAVAWGSLILAEYQDRSTLEVYPPDKILGLAALLKHAVLHEITQTNVGSAEELYAFGAQVTESAHLSLSLRASVTALEHLVPGDYCASCLAAYRCPALAKKVHTGVYGELQAPDDEEAVPLKVREPVDEDARAVLERHVAKLPAIKAWVDSVERAAGVAPAKRQRRLKKKRRGRGARAPKRAPSPAPS